MSYTPVFMALIMGLLLLFGGIFGMPVDADVAVIGGADGPTDGIVTDGAAEKNPMEIYESRECMPLDEAIAIQQKIDEANDEMTLAEEYGSLRVTHELGVEQAVALFETEYGLCTMYIDESYAIYEIGGRSFISIGNQVQVTDESFFTEETSGLTADKLLNGYDEDEHCIAARYEGETIYLLTEYTADDGLEYQQEYVLDAELHITAAHVYTKNGDGDFELFTTLAVELGAEIELPDFVKDYVY